MNLVFKESPLDLPSFKMLRKSVGWNLPPDGVIESSLRNTEYCVSAWLDGALAGMGRIVGDHSFIYFIADIIVVPEHQGRGIGAGIMTRIMDYLERNAPENSYITLMAAKGKEPFYEKFGFFKRPTDRFGHGMMVELSRR